VLIFRYLENNDLKKEKMIMDNISENINIIETTKEILFPPKEKIISILELFNLVGAPHL